MPKQPSVSNEDQPSRDPSALSNARTAAGNGPPPPHDASLTFAVGEVLAGSSYVIVKLIGQGAMSQVFEAQDSALRRRVAVKVLLPGNDPVLLRKEAQALAAVRHPGLVVIHGLGVHRGLEYLVMERILGVTLEEQLDTRRIAGTHFTVAETLELLLTLTGVLTAIHGAGVAHRDVKPSNIMLCPNDRVVLMDLGIVAPEVEVGDDAPMVGTPYYMAPEAIEGRVAPGAAHLLDIYALGVIAYEMLCGGRPYEGATTLEVLDLHLYAPLPDVERVMPWVPPRLAALIRDCMAKQAGERPPSVEQVTWQLRALQSSARAPLTAAGYSILIVDESLDHALMLRSTAQRLLEGVEVVIVADGDRALDSVAKKAPDLILLDLALPGMNGVELCMYLRGTAAADRATIVAISTAASDRDREVLRQLGVAHILTRGPGLPQELVRVLERIVPFSAIQR